MTTKLKRVVSIQAGGTPSVDDPANWADQHSGGVPWVSIGDMSDGKAVTSTARAVSVDGIRSKRLPIAPAGTLLFAMYASVGAVAELGVEASWNQALVGLTPRPDMAHGRFVRYWLEHLRSDLGALVRSNTQDNLNAEQVGNFPFPATSLSDQQAIAAFLDSETASIDALIAKKRSMIDLLDERRWAVLDAVSGLGRDGWRTTCLKRLAVLFTDGDWIESPYITTSGIRLIQTGNIGRGFFKDQGDRFISEATFRELKCTEVHPGDVLISRLANTVGQACIAPDLGGRMVTSVDVVILRPTSAVHAEFLVRYLSTDRHVSRARLEARGTTMQRLARSQVGELPVSYPTLDEQTALVERVDAQSRPIADATDRLRLQIDRLVERRQALITSAVTGQLDVEGVAA